MPDSWNSHNTASPQGMTAGPVEITGHNGDTINAYFAKPDGRGPYPGIVTVMHMPGWDELYQEFTRLFANHGYTVLCPTLYFRAGHGAPDDIAAKVRADGGVPDDQVVGDLTAGMQWLKAQPTSNGRVGIVGTCS